RTRRGCRASSRCSAACASTGSTSGMRTTGTATSCRGRTPCSPRGPARRATLRARGAGGVVKPVEAVSLYGSYSVSYLPSSGDQFSSLTVITQQVEPEKFRNYEVGAKWDVLPGLSLTPALYRLDRTNTRSTDPNDPTRIVQIGSQRT